MAAICASRDGKVLKVILLQNKSFFKKDDDHSILIDVSRGLLSIYEDVKIDT